MILTLKAALFLIKIHQLMQQGQGVPKKLSVF